jgi:hypothetical protein
MEALIVVSTKGGPTMVARIEGLESRLCSGV